MAKKINAHEYKSLKISSNLDIAGNSRRHDLVSLLEKTNHLSREKSASCVQVPDNEVSKVLLRTVMRATLRQTVG